MSKRPLVVLLFTGFVLAGCVIVPTGPSVFVLPGSQKSLDQFRVDDAACRQYAIAVLGGPAAAQPPTMSRNIAARGGTACLL